jgi:peptidoglycan hydrolase CwlO-like protein
MKLTTKDRIWLIEKQLTRFGNQAQCPAADVAALLKAYKATTSQNKKLKQRVKDRDQKINEQNMEILHLEGRIRDFLGD